MWDAWARPSSCIEICVAWGQPLLFLNTFSPHSVTLVQYNRDTVWCAQVGLRYQQVNAVQAAPTTDVIHLKWKISATNKIEIWGLTPPPPPKYRVRREDMSLLQGHSMAESTYRNKTTNAAVSAPVACDAGNSPHFLWPLSVCDAQTDRSDALRCSAVGTPVDRPPLTRTRHFAWILVFQAKLCMHFLCFRCCSRSWPAPCALCHSVIITALAPAPTRSCRHHPAGRHPAPSQAPPSARRSSTIPRESPLLSYLKTGHDHFEIIRIMSLIFRSYRSITDSVDKESLISTSASLIAPR
jgi:hypothetical protein